MPLGWVDLVFALLAIIFAAGSRDTFRKYRQRLSMVLDGAGAEREEKGRLPIAPAAREEKSEAKASAELSAELDSG